MTREEEILNRLNKAGTSFITHETTYVYRESALRAMREYAMERERIAAKEFAEWMVKRKVSPIGDNHWEDWGEADTENQIVPMRTTDQLYSEYLKQQK